MNALTDIVPSPGQSEIVIANEVAEDLLARLSWMTIQPSVVLCEGCNEAVRARLQQRFPSSSIITDAANIAQVDVIIVNALRSFEDNTVLPAWRRLLRPNGLLMFSALGLDTLKEIRALVALPAFVDMHDIGDALLAAGFSDPVLDVDYYTTVYRDKQKLLIELYESGMVDGEVSDIQLAPTNEQTYELTYEVIFAHAFMPLRERSVTEDGVVKVPLSQLRRSL